MNLQGDLDDQGESHSLSGRPPMISVIIPFFNEEENLERIYNELTDVCKKEPAYEFEIIFMDNHSGDHSFSIARGIAEKDPRCRVIRLSRNFGYQANILTGYLHCRGDAAIQLDADGEDDPRLISEFLTKWREGFQVIYGVRRKRAENFLLTWQRKFFYRVLNEISAFPIPPDAGDFRLIDRRVIEALRHLGESNPYIRGLIAYAGFHQTGILYDRRPRYRGESKFTWWDYVRLAWTGISSFSTAPLQISTWVGAFFAALSFVAGLVYIILYFRGHVPVAGFTTLILAHLFLTGIQLLSLGLLGKYVGAIFEEVKGRPKSFVSEIYPKPLSLSSSFSELVPRR